MMWVNKRNLLLLSLFINLFFVAFFIGKRIYYAEKPATFAFVQSNSQFVEQTNYYTIYKSTANIVMLGNSLTYRMHWDELLQRKDVINRGVGADVTDGFSQRLNFVFNCNPKICFIEGGINDIAFGIPNNTIMTNFQHIVGEIRAKGIIPVLTAVSYVTDFSNNQKQINDSVTALNARLIDFARIQNIELINLNPMISKNNLMKPEYAEVDGLHYKSSVYLIWADEIRKVLSKHGI